MPTIAHKFALCTALAVSLSAFAKSTTPALPAGFDHAITTKEGCVINNPNPTDGESVSWSGGCVNGLADGFGVLQWYLYDKPTDRYVGEYQAGRINGVGQFVWRDGGVHTGSWLDDELHGFAESVAPKGVYQGNVYVGEFYDGKKHGKGTYYANIHNLATMRDFGDEFLKNLPKGMTKTANYLIFDAVYEQNVLVAICALNEHELC